MSRPNIFDFATSELSQDAFLCWLASWAGPEAAATSDPRIALGRAFLGALFKKHSRDLPEAISDLRIRRQHKNIDVLIVVNDTYAVCIEDKVGTTEHSGQLARYVDILKSEGRSASNILPIYLQTHEQASYDAVRHAACAVFDRTDFLSLLAPYANTNEHALEADFYRHLHRIDGEVNAFKVRSLGDWPWPAWQGFFGLLKQGLSTGMWAYVPNQSGGFMAFWWHAQTALESKAYVQLEMESLCFKVAAPQASAVERSSVRDTWMRRILDAARQLDVPLVRPGRLGNGRTMTVACLGHDYRRTGADGKLDLEGTLAELRRAQGVLDVAANEGA